MPTERYTAENTQNPGQPGVGKEFVVEMEYVIKKVWFFFKVKIYTRYKWIDPNTGHVLAEGDIKGKPPMWFHGTIMVTFNKDRGRFEFDDGPGGSRGHFR